MNISYTLGKDQYSLDVTTIQKLDSNTIRIILNQVESGNIPTLKHPCLKPGCINHGIPFLCANHQWTQSGN